MFWINDWIDHDGVTDLQAIYKLRYNGLCINKNWSNDYCPKLRQFFMLTVPVTSSGVTIK